MSKPEFDLDLAEGELPGAPAGLAHALNQLLQAIGRSHPQAGTLLDEFTAMHAGYLAQLQARARESEAHVEALDPFAQAARMIYRRLSALDAEQSSKLRAGHDAHRGSSLSVH
jgi:N-acetylglucosamine kinase-like BadF-type ATPase